jgi:hypothetical protein
MSVQRIQMDEPGLTASPVMFAANATRQGAELPSLAPLATWQALPGDAKSRLASGVKVTSPRLQ